MVRYLFYTIGDLTYQSPLVDIDYKTLIYLTASPATSLAKCFCHGRRGRPTSYRAAFGPSFQLLLFFTSAPNSLTPPAALHLISIQ